MYDALHVYGFDIESLNDEAKGYHGLIPERSRVTQIAVATDPSFNGGGEVFEGDEIQILADFTDYLASLPAGLLTGWNSAFFDLPFIYDRARTVAPAWMPHLIAQPGLRPKYQALPGHATDTNPGGGYTAAFHGFKGLHAHLDVSQAYHRYADETGVSWSLKPVCDAQGIDMFVIDRTRVHEYSPEDQKRYVLSDASGARELALRTLGLDYKPYR